MHKKDVIYVILTPSQCLKCGIHFGNFCLNCYYCTKYINKIYYVPPEKRTQSRNTTQLI